MSISITDWQPSRKFLVDYTRGGLTEVFARITLDSSYPSGGYSTGQNFKPSTFGLKEILGMQVLAKASAGAADFDIELNRTTKGTPKIAVTRRGGSLAPLTIEETVTITANAGRLANVPAYIFTAEASAGGTTGSLKIIPTGSTVATKQVAVNFLTGALATFGTDAVTAVRISYVPLGVGPFIESNRVIDEVVVAAAAKVNLANRAALVQYVYDSTDGSVETLIPAGEAPGATHIAAIDINDGGNTSIDTHADDDGNSLKVTYWKHSALGGAQYGWTDQADITITSTTLFAIADDLAVPPQGIWIPGLGNIIVGETGAAANLEAVIEGPRGTAGANIALYDPLKGSFALTGADAYVTIELPYMILNPAQIFQNSGEIPAGVNLSSATYDVKLIGRPS